MTLFKLRDGPLAFVSTTGTGLRQESRSSVAFSLCHDLPTELNPVAPSKLLLSQQAVVEQAPFPSHIDVGI
jgi:hypothetical protein